jgi:MFS family permease
VTRPLDLPGRIAAQGALSIRLLWRRMPWYVPANSPDAHNLRLLYTETVWFGVLSGLAGTYVAVYALRLGATNGQIGWLTALPALVTIFWMMPAARLIERQRRPIPLIAITGVLQRLAYISMAAVPWLLGAGLVEALILLNALAALPSGVISTAITSLLPELTTPDRRGQIVSVRWLLLSTAEMLAALFAGQLLGLMPVPLNYQAVIGGGAVLSLMSIVYLRRMRLPDRAVRQPAAARDRQGREQPSLRKRLAAMLGQRRFARFTLASFVFYWGIYLPAPLWSIIRVRDLSASDAWIGAIAMVVGVSTITGYLMWGRWAGRRGTQWSLRVSGLGVGIYALLTAAVPTIAWMIPTSLLGGFCWAGCNLALFNILLAVCPAERRPTYIAVYTALINITAFLGPLLGAALANWIGIRLAFALSGAIRLLGLLLFWRLLR